MPYTFYKSVLGFIFAKMFLRKESQLNTFYKSIHFSFVTSTAQGTEFFFKKFFSKCDQIRWKLRIWLHLLNKSLTEKFIFYAVEFLRLKFS